MTENLRKVIIGGTFAYLHAGHRALLAAAFSAGDIVFIGLTSDEHVKREKGQLRPAFEERKARIIEFVTQFGKPFSISSLNGKLGDSITGDYDAIAVSEETKAGADKINEIRVANGLKPLEVILVKCLAAEDGSRISSTSIYYGKMDGSGKKISPQKQKNATM